MATGAKHLVITATMLLAANLLASNLLAQVASLPQHHRFHVECDNASVEVSSQHGTVSDEQALQAIEESARQLRARILKNKENASPKNSVQSGAVPETGIVPRLPADGFAAPTELVATSDDVADASPWWDEYTFSLFPRTLFWQPPLANPSQPRMYAKLSSLSDANTSNTIDTAIGGTVGLYRFSPSNCLNQGAQIDFFAVVLSRWSTSSHAVGSDYRFGIPLTFAWGNWQAKIAYEHTSSHLGDDFILNKGRFQEPNVHDEIVLGLAYRFVNALRVYGICGVPIRAYNPAGEAAKRFDWGVEWSRQVSTSIYGQPFAAFDMEFREEQDYTANITGQVGWQWQNMDNGRSLRLALEMYDGKSNLGQFFLDRERWASIGVYLDY